ncbi:hypothetical protein QYF36_018183 [Acer negundo]|nr:hypothetical protein QYF36_018183 [Acer negundo]
MEKYFRNAYRGDPGVPQADPYRFYNMWIGSTVFSALTWSNPYMWQLSTQLNWHDKISNPFPVIPKLLGPIQLQLPATIKTTKGAVARLRSAGWRRLRLPYFGPKRAGFALLRAVEREFSLSVANCKGTRGSRTDHLTFHAVIQELKQSVSSVHMARKDLKCFTKLAQSSHVKE